jgi:hypothetical protein
MKNTIRFLVKCSVRIIPEPDQLAAIVAVLRVCDPMNLTEMKLSFCGKR